MLVLPIDVICYMIVELSLVYSKIHWRFHTPPKLELLYRIAPELWNRGLATEIAQTLGRYGFEVLDFSEVWASTDAPNVASTSVLKKAGLRLEKRAVVDGLETLFYCLPRSAF